ncbi:MAG: PEP-CTERM sorting domain-containing protein, partial [Alphaproteobacteria bacterium]|nr:PEP-CTERM sorting domain-containing protein [Alphaproteobacteria bacterium]
VYRVGPGGNVLESTLVVYDFTASDVRFGTGPAPVPEPAPLALLGLGLLATAARRRRG